MKASGVYLDYDQQSLDNAYDQSVYAPNREQLLARLPTTSELVRKCLGAPQRFTYGPAPIEQLDLYKTKKSNAPIIVYIHGDAWRAGLAKNYAFPAEMFVQHPRADRCDVCARNARVSAPVARFSPTHCAKPASPSN